MYWQWLILRHNNFRYQQQAGVAIDAIGSIGNSDGNTAGAPFWQSHDISNVQASSIDLDFNGHDWWNKPMNVFTEDLNNTQATIATATQLVTQPKH